MKKNMLILAVIVLVIGVALFHEQVWALFRGMTPLESLKFIFNYVLHVVVVTIACYIAYTLPEIAMPIIRFLKSFFRGLRHSRRAARRNGLQAKPVSIRSPKLTTDMLLREYVLKQALPKTGRGNPAPTLQDDIRLDF